MVLLVVTTSTASQYAHLNFVLGPTTCNKPPGLFEGGTPHTNQDQTLIDIHTYHIYIYILYIFIKNVKIPKLYSYHVWRMYSSKHMESKGSWVTLPPRVLNPKTADPVAEFSCWVKKISFRSTPMMVKYILA